MVHAAFALYDKIGVSSCHCVVDLLCLQLCQKCGTNRNDRNDLVSAISEVLSIRELLTALSTRFSHRTTKVI